MTKLEVILKQANPLSARERARLMAILSNRTAQESEADKEAAGQRGLDRLGAPRRLVGVLPRPPAKRPRHFNVTRGEIWWAELAGDAGYRPVAVVSQSREKGSDQNGTAA